MKGRVRALSGHDLNMTPSFPWFLSVYAASPAPPPVPLSLLHQLTSLHDIWRIFCIPSQNAGRYTSPLLKHFFPQKSAIILRRTSVKRPSISLYMQESPRHRFTTSKYYVLAISVSNFITLSAFLLSIWILFSSSLNYGRGVTVDVV